MVTRGGVSIARNVIFTFSFFWVFFSYIFDFRSLNSCILLKTTLAQQRVSNRDGHDTDTDCRYLRVGGKYRYLDQVSIVSILRLRCLCSACMRKNMCCQIEQVGILSEHALEFALLTEKRLGTSKFSNSIFERFM